VVVLLGLVLVLVLELEEVLFVFWVVVVGLVG
jgi:hypothetical protein